MPISNKEIIKKLPKDFQSFFIRDLSVLTCSIFTESTARNMKDLFGADFSLNLWLRDHEQASWYLSAKELNKYAATLGKQLRGNRAFAKYISSTLREMTDWFLDFIKHNKSKRDFLKRAQIFIHLHRIFFAYHFTVRLCGEYLAESIANGNKDQDVIFNHKILDEAWKYNEMVVPSIEKYYKNIGLDNYCCYEINTDQRLLLKKSAAGRSSIFIKNISYTLSELQSKELKKILEKRQLNNFSKIKQVKGNCANTGRASGRVKLVTELSKLNTLKDGDILVTSNTRPHFNAFIKKVAAIVTDEGGALCHAAILAREFNIPCVINTKIATKVFKNGDLVEVDANRGIVRIVQRSMIMHN
jgi:phosphoenolpyruvate synthase/pyruvate phosphate dikinase